MNLLMIVADQHRADALGAFGRFDIKTPNLDRLAAEGTYFKNAFTPLPVCTPARQSMLTGLNPDSYGCFDFASFCRIASDNGILGHSAGKNGDDLILGKRINISGFVFG